MKVTLIVLLCIFIGGSSRKLSEWQALWAKDGKFWEGVYTEKLSFRRNLNAFIRQRPEFGTNYLKKVCTKYYDLKIDVVIFLSSK